ncbi:MAG: TrbC/VirB2 family protein [Elusimicrobiota bacterium]
MMRRIAMKTPAFKARLGLAGAVLLMALPAMAQTYGSDIINETTNFYTGFLRAFGGVVMLLGLGWGGIKIAYTHDTENLNKPMLVILGGVVIMAAPSIVNLIMNVFPSVTLNQ